MLNLANICSKNHIKKNKDQYNYTILYYNLAIINIINLTYDWELALNVKLFTTVHSAL